MQPSFPSISRFSSESKGCVFVIVTTVVPSEFLKAANAKLTGAPEISTSKRFAAGIQALTEKERNKVAFCPMVLTFRMLFAEIADLLSVTFIRMPLTRGHLAALIRLRLILRRQSTDFYPVFAINLSNALSKL